jgi:hypothetical protein
MKIKLNNENMIDLILGKRSTIQQKWPLKTVTHKKKHTTIESNIH